MTDRISLEQLQSMSEVFGPYIDIAIEKAVSRGKVPVCVHSILAKQPLLGPGGKPTVYHQCHGAGVTTIRHFRFCYKPCYDPNCSLPSTLPPYLSAIGPLPVRYTPRK